MSKKYKVEFIIDGKVGTLYLGRKELKTFFSKDEIKNGWSESEAGCFKITKED